MTIKCLFTDHQASVGETYREHMGVAFSFAGPLFKAAFASTVHAFLPFLCVTTASATVKRLNERIVSRCKACPSGRLHRPDLFVHRPTARPLGELQLGWDPVI